MNVIIIEKSMPATVTALSHDNLDGTYTIICNRNKPKQVQIKGILHELGHIYADDFISDTSATLLEKMMHQRDLEEVSRSLIDVNFFYVSM